MTEHIENNNIHLTQSDRLNLKNLGVSVKLYGAVGDGNADDTSAFTEALENNNRVYVPGGIYRITGELVISENCELELAQDAVLDFKSTNDEVIPEAFKCITLSSSSRLVGNHATIRVPYSFEGTVIRISANPDDDTICISPRYLKDINIVKLIESGEHEDSAAALDNVTHGTALLIEGLGVEENSTPSILWGVEASGIRIAGAFDYGIRCVNTNHEISGKMPWKYETSIDAFIESCRTGIYMDHYSNARISAVVQTRQAYRYNLDDEDGLNYADYGIHLVDSKYINLKNSRIITMDPESGEITVPDEFKHINLVDDCTGLMIENSLCTGEESYNVRDYIHTETAENFDNMTVFGEPNANYYNYYGEDAVEGFLYHNYRIETEENPGALAPTFGTTSTCLIPCNRNSTIVVKDFTFTNEFDINKEYHPNRIVLYNNEAEFLRVITYDNFNKYHLTCKDLDDGGYEITFNKTASELKPIDSIRMCCNTENIGMRPTVTVYNTDENGITTKDVTYLKNGCLKDRVYIKPRYIDGLEETIEELSNRITTLEDSN